jgi:7-cyano-7-deazaguanine synthase in queuosine biosynthesis
MRQKLIIRDDIIVDLPNGPIGINFSGGADSSLLVYLVLNQLRNHTVHLFTISTLERHFTQHKTTADVLAKICSLTNNYNILHYVSIHDKNTEGANNIQHFPKQLLYEKQIIKSLLYGNNCNPKIEDLPDVNRFDWDDQSRSPLYTRSLMSSLGQYCPLTNLTKQDICKIYQKQGILESVFPITKSCGTPYGTDPCEKCWFCIERKWGLSALN